MSDSVDGASRASLLAVTLKAEVHEEERGIGSNVRSEALSMKRLEQV